ncbi:UDP-N-acetylglucosamine 2-epimerase (non-hydrolyzing) [Aliiroseovarius subalbicans]|uniref:non-hydrolyzing UDP-N-acetylglucosamine 2-epimerase n=1 Tax=Aliiroseovarius subalbicans TaxID=2925840 RepID=UPI001F57C21A|nr:UDP-N-acetylglucosamine 2-epimerase (non-hydrolyzing) [Aliiroseovarius subalbicans]MCI2397792.1 UDP-N-acetylglucosamine 2-epimerase (non-hydrolyzing) [Aliiroseovarius subalbicans]
MKRILTVIGARPQFIKAAAVSRAISATKGVNEILVHTGQHYDANMSDIFFQEMGIPTPAYQLDISGGSHGQMTGRMLEQLEAIMLKEQPDAVLVYGDTNSTMAGALAAAKLNIPLAHVEAGLRSFNCRMPEEVNRVLTDHCASLLLTPTDTATQNLAEEGITGDQVVQVGDVMYDAALFFGRLAGEHSNLLETSGVDVGRFVLATIHRQENTDDPERLRAVFEGLEKVARTLPVVVPLHPRTKGRLEDAGMLNLTDNLKTVAPLGYIEMVAHERAAAVIVTDSGGVQKEAFFYGVPCVTLRDETEWVELVEAGWNRLVPPLNAAIIAQAVSQAVGTKGQNVTPYGAGDASERIVSTLLRFLRK